MALAVIDEYAGLSSGAGGFLFGSPRVAKGEGEGVTKFSFESCR